MMHPVHFRSNDEKAQYPIDWLWQAHIAVIEQACRVQQNLKENHGQRGNPQNKNCPDLDAHRKENFQEVKTNSGRCIEIEIRMMHHMKAPKDGKRMEYGVL